ncbi:hypothetical protein HDC90_001131 [Pedobacter sp. AK013]|uniref:hypothetical protein n=1 Tax=Pedobacter sp. AK013 TaxID=2723071 RepID=UPI00161992CC|nr:hypothetical protein [Pedobacter sp. AK013]MBB6236519.1 hypothetical protein [Pedobacter sp. AK013]
MSNEFGIIKVEELEKKEKFWYGGVKFIKIRPSHESPDLIYCEMDDPKNHFVFISKNAETEREL